MIHAQIHGRTMVRLNRRTTMSQAQPMIRMNLRATMSHARIHVQTMIHLNPRMRMTRAQTMIHMSRSTTMTHAHWIQLQSWLSQSLTLPKIFRIFSSRASCLA
tara:strand:+ start:1395 stop:1703 length:309 start_codon:yes stop_codon:yes gene_type:complete